MEIKKTLVIDSGEPLSKALSHLHETPAVIVTKSGKYYGIIDVRSINAGVRDPKNTKCETVMVKPPVMSETSGVLDMINGFLLGHFKALPVIAPDQSPLGVTTRVELLKEMINDGLVPKGPVSDYMSSPVFSIDEDETISKAKAVFKEKNTRRLVVMRKGNPIGVVSTFDISSLKGNTNLAGGRKDIHLSENIKIDDVSISGFLRPDITVVDESSSIEDAVARMIEKEVSGVIVTSGKKAVGVLSALDLFKRVKEVAQEGLDIHISGLGEENILHYDNIKAKFGHVLSKFSKTFNIRNVSVHVKEEKSTFTVSIGCDTDEGHVALKGERGTLKETVDELALELDKVLRRKKDKRRPKARSTHYGRRHE